MKKYGLFVFLFSLRFLSPAQDLTSKHGESILPEAKDWGVGIDATRLLNKTQFGFVYNSQMFYGKYFVQPNKAYRFGLRLGYDNIGTTQRAIDRVNGTTNLYYPSTYKFKDNVWHRNAVLIGFSFGIEKRKGKTRLQGFYGVEGGFYFAYYKDKFNYGNTLSATTGSQVTVDTTDAMSSSVLGAANNVTGGAPIVGISSGGLARVVERYSGLYFSINARVFVGVEYFVLPKLSIGGEFGWGPTFSINGRSSVTYESIGSSTAPGASTAPSVQQSVVDGGRNSSFSLDNDNFSLLGGASASLKVMFHF